MTSVLVACTIGLTVVSCVAMWYRLRVEELLTKTSHRASKMNALLLQNGQFAEDAKAAIEAANKATDAAVAAHAKAEEALQRIGRLELASIRGAPSPFGG